MLLAIESLSKKLDAIIQINPETDPDSLAFNAVLEIWKGFKLESERAVLIILPHSKDFILQLFAIYSAGHIPIVLNPAMPIERIKTIIASFGINLVLGCQAFDQHLDYVCCHHIGEKKVWVLGNQAHIGLTHGHIVLSTSGTSGTSKGCIFELAQLLENAYQHCQAIGLSAQDTLLINLPVYYSYALVAQVFAGLLIGAQLILSGLPFNSACYTQAIRKYSITSSSLTPTLTRHLLHKKKNAFSSLRSLTVGGDSLSVHHIKNIRTDYPQLELYLTYGLTEAGPRIATLPAHAVAATRWPSVGLPLANTRLYLFEQNALNKCLCIYSNTIMKDTLGTAHGSSFIYHDNLRWLVTGDYFEQDDAGYLYYKGRCSDFKIIAGEKISFHTIRSICTKQACIQSVDFAYHYGNENELIAYDIDLKINERFSEQFHTIARSIMRQLMPAERPKVITLTITHDQGLLHYK